MKRLLIALAAAVSLLAQGCQVASFIAHGTVPDSVQVKRLDNMSGARGLAVMAVGTGVQTRAGEEAQDRLCIIDKDGQTVLASFTFEDSSGGSSLWKKIRETLTLVPNEIYPLTDKYLYLQGTLTSHDYDNWRKDALSGNEERAITDLLGSLEGDYILRTSDGALFRSPLEWMNPIMQAGISPDFWFQLAPDGKTLVFSGRDVYGKKGLMLEPYVVTDEGNKLVSKSLPEDVEMPGNTRAFCVTEDSRIIHVPMNGAKGFWSYDLDLKPLYLDCGESITQWPAKYGPFWSSVFFPFDHAIYSLAYSQGENSVSLFRFVVDGYTLECSPVASGNLDDRYWRNVTESDDQYPARKKDYGWLFYYEGGFLKVDIKGKTITPHPFPEGFPPHVRDYDADGFAWVLSDDRAKIIRYDLNTLTSRSVDIRWNGISLDQFILVESECVGGLFSLTCTTRDAQKYSYIIDAETGEVTESQVFEYEGPVIKTFVRLN